MKLTQMEHTQIEQYPATYESLVVANDHSPFTRIENEAGHEADNKVSDESEAVLHDVLVDGIRGQAGIGSFGAFSERIKIRLEKAHPELDTEFQTKYFMFTAPGKIEWGHHGQNFEILKLN